MSTDSSNESPQARPDAAPTLRDEDFEPVGRDYRFLFRLVAALLVGVAVAAWVGMRARTAAASCGAGLIRPGSTVIPAAESRSGR